MHGFNQRYGFGAGGVKSLPQPADPLDECFVDEGRRAGSVSGDGAPGDEAGHFRRGEAGRGGVIGDEKCRETGLMVRR